MMQLITFINFEDLPLLETGYTMKDQLASAVSEYLSLLNIEYATEFACMGVVPSSGVFEQYHPLQVFGNTL